MRKVLICVTLVLEAEIDETRDEREAALEAAQEQLKKGNYHLSGENIDNIENPIF